MDSYTLLSKENIFYVLQNIKAILSDVNIFLIFFKKIFIFLSHYPLLSSPSDTNSGFPLPQGMCLARKRRGWQHSVAEASAE